MDVGSDPLTTSTRLRMNNKLKAFGMMLALALPGFVAAEDAEEEDTGPWSGNVSLGYLESSGNTDSTSATAEFLINYETGAWNHELSGRGFSSSDDDVTTAESYHASWQSSWNFTEVDYLFGALDWNKDRFSGFNQQLFATAGYGRTLLDTEKFELNLEIGAGYSTQELVNGTTEDNGTGRASGNFTWNFGTNASFEQELASFYTPDNTFVESISSITAGLIGDIGLTFSYTVRRNSDVLPGIENTDRFTVLALRYEF